MSWGEVYKINNNMKRAINEQLRDMTCRPIRVITTTGTYTPERTGLYKVICVGEGGKGSHRESSNGYSGGGGGGGGGVAIKTLRLSNTTNYNIEISTSVSFTHDGNVMTANKGGNASSASGGSGGTASGGDENYTGANGGSTEDEYNFPIGGSVGVHIGELSKTITGSAMVDTNTCMYTYGSSLLGYGGGGTGAGYWRTTSAYGGTDIYGLPGAVIIIPLEMEE